MVSFYTENRCDPSVSVDLMFHWMFDWLALAFTPNPTSNAHNKPVSDPASDCTNTNEKRSSNANLSLCHNFSAGFNFLSESADRLFAESSIASLCRCSVCRGAKFMCGAHAVPRLQRTARGLRPGPVPLNSAQTGKSSADGLRATIF